MRLKVLKLELVLKQPESLEVKYMMKSFGIKKRVHQKNEHAGGFEGGMTTGMPIVVRGVMKPIPTLYKPIKSVDIDTKEAFYSEY